MPLEFGHDLLGVHPYIPASHSRSWRASQNMPAMVVTGHAAAVCEMKVFPIILTLPLGAAYVLIPKISSTWKPRSQSAVTACHLPDQHRAGNEV